MKFRKTFATVRGITNVQHIQRVGRMALQQAGKFLPWQLREEHGNNRRVDQVNKPILEPVSEDEKSRFICLECKLGWHCKHMQKLHCRAEWIGLTG